MLQCVSDRNGEGKKYVISKKIATNRRSNKDDTEIESEEEEDEDDDFDEFVCSESDSEDDDEDIQDLEDTAGGQYVLYRYTSNKYYVAGVIENTTDKVVLRCARKYGTRDHTITFIWPEKDDIASVDSLIAPKFKRLPYPTIGRRGSSMTFTIKAFGKIILTQIY